MIAGTRFPARIRAVFAEQRPEIVFHAAAHKHVPLMEGNPGEAITNNVLGTRNLLDAALASGVERFVMISTDKAVNPTNMMGASKREAELLVDQAAQGPACLCRRTLRQRAGVTRQRGAHLQAQIAAGGPVTVTHPEMRRYFMTIPEAVQLVLQAAVLGRGGEVFVLDMGEPVKIADLANDLIRLSGLRPDVRAGEEEARAGEGEKGRAGGAGLGYRGGVHGVTAGREAVRGVLHPRRVLRRTADQNILWRTTAPPMRRAARGWMKKYIRIIAAANSGDRASSCRPCRRWCRNTSRRGRRAGEDERRRREKMRR